MSKGTSEGGKRKEDLIKRNRLIAWYNDPGTQQPPTQWPYQVMANNTPVSQSEVRVLASARRDGSLDLALWLPIPPCNLSSYHPYVCIMSSSSLITIMTIFYLSYRMESFLRMDLVAGEMAIHK